MNLTGAVAIAAGLEFACAVQSSGAVSCWGGGGGLMLGRGTSVVTGSGAPTAGLVYKLVEVDGRPVAKRSASKESKGGRKSALRRHRPTGTATEEVVHPFGVEPGGGPQDRVLPVPLMRGGRRVEGLPGLPDARERLREALVSVPWEGLKLSRGEPAIPTVFLG